MSVHAILLPYVRKGIEDGIFGADLTALMTAWDDEQIIRHMFLTARGRGSKIKGARLSSTGLHMVEKLFRSYTVASVRQAPVTFREILFLERRTALPYYVDHEKIVVFDSELAVVLQMVDGDVAKLMSIEQ